MEPLPTGEAKELASWGRRLAALLVDVAVLGLVVGVTLFAAGMPADELRRRIEAEDAADGDVRDMRSLWIMGYLDPDGAAHEVILRRPGTSDSDLLPRAAWTTVTLG